VLGGLAYDELHALHPKAYFPFPDRHGRPIYVERTGLADADLLNALVDLDRLEGHHIMSMETDLANLYALASAAAGRVVTKQTTILDFKEMTLKLANANSRTYVKRMSAVDSANYPETLGRLLIINAPSFFSVAWAMVKGFLDPVTVEKISIHGGPAEWLPKLRELIDEDKTPVEYGGTLAIEGGLFPARCGTRGGRRAGGAAQANVCSLPSASATRTLPLPSPPPPIPRAQPPPARHAQQGRDGGLPRRRRRRDSHQVARAAGRCVARLAAAATAAAARSAPAAHLRCTSAHFPRADIKWDVTFIADSDGEGSATVAAAVADYKDCDSTWVSKVFTAAAAGHFVSTWDNRAGWRNRELFYRCDPMLPGADGVRRPELPGKYGICVRPAESGPFSTAAWDAMLASRAAAAAAAPAAPPAP
jgi:hypothetical protein